METLSSPSCPEEVLQSEPILRYYLARMVGRQAAEDLIQETYERVLRSAGGFRGTSSVKTWVLKIATNLAIDHLRKARRESKRLHVTAVTGEELETAGAFPDIIDGRSWNLPEEVLERKEMIDCIAEFINQLQPTMKSTFLLRELQAASIDDMAEILQLSKENVRVRIHRSRESLRKALSAGCHVYQARSGNILCDRK